MISVCTGLPVAAVDELEIEDFVALTEMLESFLPAGLQTGQRSSAT